MNANVNPQHRRRAGKSVGAADSWRHLYGLRSELAVWMDAVRQSHRCQVPLGSQRDPDRFHHLRADRNLAAFPSRLPRSTDSARAGWCSAAGILVGIAWVLNSTASSLADAVFAAAIGGVGTGCVYGTASVTRSNVPAPDESRRRLSLPRASVPVRRSRSYRS